MMATIAPQATPCPTCGEIVPPAAPMGQCPNCLWKVSFEGAEKDSDDLEPWLVLGDYELFEEIARGGMGVVYRARQRKLNREVAVKVLRGGEFADEKARRRFQIEAGAAARLQHPGIVAIHDVGEDDGVPWFSMDYLPGGNLSRQAGDTLPSTREAAICVRRGAEAVEHAHAHGVLHRDLKPSNILLGDDGLPRVTDFGIARRLTVDTTTGEPLTRTGQGMGSPGYAAPELAFGGTADARADVYGLGALLYYLLTGRPPFEGPTLDAVLLQLRENDPVPPRRLNPSVPRDLETICLHALDKESAKRYSSAKEVAEELERFLAGNPIQARPLSPANQGLRWFCRHPLVAGMALLVVLLVAGLIASGFLYGARQARLEHRANLLADARIQRAATLNNSRARALADLLEAWKIKPSTEIRNEAIACLSLPEIEAEGVIPTPTPPPRARANETLTASIDGQNVIVSDAGTGEVAHKLTHPRKVFCVDWRGELLVAMCEDRFIYIWDAASGTLKHRLSGHEGLPVDVVFRHDGQEFVSIARDSYLRLWQGARGVEEVQYDRVERHVAPVWWSNDDRILYCTREDGKGVDVYKVNWPRSVKILASPGDELHTENTRSLALSPDGRLAATVDEHSLRVWDIPAGRQIASVKKSPTEWMSARFAPNGESLWVCGFDTMLLRFPIAMEDGVPTLKPAEKVSTRPGLRLVEISPDGNQLALAHNSESRWVLLSAAGDSFELPGQNLLEAAFSPDGKMLATTSYSETGVNLWSLPGGTFLRELPTESPAMFARFTPDGHSLWLMTGSVITRLDTNNWQRLFSQGAGDLRALTFSPDGKLAAAQERGVIRLLRADDLGEIARFIVPPSAGWLGDVSLDFSANGNILAAHTALGCLVTWDIQSLRSELRALGMDW